MLIIFLKVLIILMCLLVGLVVGGMVGMFIGLGALAVPGLGPMIAAGTLATALGTLGIGAILGGLIGALVGFVATIPMRHSASNQ